MLELRDLDLNLYHYTPSRVGSVIFIVLFAVSTAIHGHLCWRLRAWFFIPVVIGGIFELLGYCARAAGSTNLGSIGVYIVQAVVILLAPALFAASIYMTLSRIIRLVHAEHLAMINVRRISRFFVLSDLACFQIQSVGANLQALDSKTLKNIGKWIVVGGLVLQVVMFGFFMVVAGRFHRSVRRRPTAQSIDPGMPWERSMYVMYGTSLLVLIRNCVRVADYAQGTYGWITDHEAMLFALDAVPMFTVLSVLLIWHPARLLSKAQRLERVSSSQDGFLAAQAGHVSAEERLEGAVRLTTLGTPLKPDESQRVGSS
ncbi:hypothetical protein LTR85_004177 [Meristemomyces frigidus]|nr:hypothetical protein LTR85_004177 [Meristemomyces frigidus]